MREDLTTFGVSPPTRKGREASAKRAEVRHGEVQVGVQRCMDEWHKGQRNAKEPKVKCRGEEAESRGRPRPREGERTARITKRKNTEAFGEMQRLATQGGTKNPLTQQGVGLKNSFWSENLLLVKLQGRISNPSSEVLGVTIKIVGQRSGSSFAAEAVTDRAEEGCAVVPVSGDKSAWEEHKREQADRAAGHVRD